MDLNNKILHILITTVFVQGYRFMPMAGQCYQLYRSDEFVSSCRREVDLTTQSCIRWMSDRSCLGLTTPTNERVMLRCTNRLRFDMCFEVYDKDQNVNLVCQEIFAGNAVGIKTPDNFTIVFHNELCRTAINLFERKIFSNFVDNFSLDVDTRSCYKIYDKRGLVHPYNCLSPDIDEACVFEMEGGCTALTTTNNEVLILDCPNDDQKPIQKSCFYVYNSDNEVHTVCQEKLEERCIGVVTPSNLTVLFECFFCSELTNVVFYNREVQKRQRQFVKQYLANEYQGKTTHSLNSGYILFKENQFEVLHPSWIPKTSCYGVKLESNDSILLECMTQTENEEQAGCFSLVSSENEKQIICAEVINEACVGLKLSKKLSIGLDCYGLGEYNMGIDGISKYYSEFFTNFFNNDYEFLESYNGFKEGLIGVYDVYKLEDKPDCLGLEIEDEVVLLECSNDKINRSGCFDVIKRNQTNFERSCLMILEKGCVGIKTPSNWTFQFHCFDSTPRDRDGVLSAAIPGFEEAEHDGFNFQLEEEEDPDAAGFIDQTIPNNGMPDRKIVE